VFVLFAVTRSASPAAPRSWRGLLEVATFGRSERQPEEVLDLARPRPQLASGPLIDLVRRRATDPNGNIVSHEPNCTQLTNEAR
jgi:hypothetical protein